MDSEINKLKKEISEIESGMNQLTIDYELSMKRERDRISAIQHRIRSIHSQEFQKIRQDSIQTRKELIVNLRAIYGDSFVVDFMEKAPLW